MQISLPREIENTIVAAYQAGDLDGVIARLSEAFRNEQVRAILTEASIDGPDDAAMPEHVSLAELTTKHGDKTVADFQDLLGDFSPADETAEQFLAPIARLRQDSPPRELP